MHDLFCTCEARLFFEAAPKKLPCLRSTMLHSFKYEYASLYLRTTIVGRYIYCMYLLLQSWHYCRAFYAGQMEELPQFYVPAYERNIQFTFVVMLKHSFQWSWKPKVGSKIVISTIWHLLFRFPVILFQENYCVLLGKHIIHRFPLAGRYSFFVYIMHYIFIWNCVK